MTQPLREHFEVETDAGTTLRTFDYIDALEKYIAEQLKQGRNKAIDEAIEVAYYHDVKPHRELISDLPKQCQDILESIGGCVFPEGSCQKCSQKTLNL